MNPPEEDFAARRLRLSAQIARQRSEFSEAYTRLEKPIRYTEYSLRGFGFLRSNPWIFAAVPAAVTIIKTLWGGTPKKKKSLSESQPLKTQPTAPELTGLKKTVVTWAGHGWRLFQLYRRVRSYFP
ncbi:MAG: hypothetical protein LV481_10365 [Methylacidiphilales bacterium]|nr:hypothetical protein [Candidatus Methylacidiphilales bacterium]